MNTRKFKLGQVVKMTHLPVLSLAYDVRKPSDKFFIVVGYDKDGLMEVMPCFESASRFIGKYKEELFEAANISDYASMCSCYKKIEPDVTIKTDFKKYVIAEFSDHDKITIKASASCHDDDNFDLQQGVRIAIERLMKSVADYGDFKDLNDWFYDLDSEKQKYLFGGGFHPNFTNIIAYYVNEIDNIKGNEFRTVYDLYIDKKHGQYVLKHNENNDSRGYIYGTVDNFGDLFKFDSYTKFIKHVFTVTLPNSKLDAWWSSLTEDQKNYAMSMRKG